MLNETWDWRNLDNRGYTLVEYVWLGGCGDDLRSKSRVIKKEVKTIEDLPVWNYDGSSCYQAKTENSEVLIIPVALFDDPFKGAPHKVCMCETEYQAGKIPTSNFRRIASKIFSEKNVSEHDPWFGIEQEYIITRRIGSTIDWPLGWPQGSYPKAEGLYYCGTGDKYTYGREISDAHIRACLFAGVQVFGTNSENTPGQWEFQVGTSKGIDIGDHLWIGRWLLRRVAEKFNVDVTFHPKPFEGWSGSGAHCNYSNKLSRNDKNMENIKKQLAGLEKYHLTCQKLYGDDNVKRLLGGYEAPEYEAFSWGVSSRKSSVRIPKVTADNGYGYYEDRRPASNVDPYIVSALIFSATCLDGAYIEDIENQYEAFLKSRRENGCPRVERQ